MQADQLNLKAIDASMRQAWEQPHWTTASRSLDVVLLQPPAQGAVRSLLPHFQTDEGIGFKPPLGLLYVASYLKAHSGHAVRVVDCQARRLSVEAAVEQVGASRPDLIGISAWTDFWWPAQALGRAMREAFPEACICVGGPHVAIYPRETLDQDFVDAVVVGDGELPFFYLANMVANGRIDNGCPGLHFKRFGVKPHPELFFIQADLDSLPFPDRDLTPREDYSSVLGQDAMSTTMITSRGCPNACVFCKLHFQKTISRSADNVVAEFKRIAAQGYTEVELYDDTFTWSKKRVRDICAQLIEADLGLRWAIRDRVSNADDELLELMKMAGCVRVNYGVESGVDRILEVVKKKITVAQATRAVRMAKSHGLTVLCFFMFGNPEETLEDMEATLRYALSLPADYCEFSVAIPYPGTRMYADALASGIIPDDYWKAYALRPVRDFEPPRLIENLVSREQLIAINARAYKKFYFRPRYMLARLLEVKNPGELLRKARIAARLLLATLRPKKGVDA